MIELKYNIEDNILTIQEIWVPIDQRREGLAKKTINGLIDKFKPEKVVAWLVMPNSRPFWYRLGFMTDKNDVHNMVKELG